MIRRRLYLSPPELSSFPLSFTAQRFQGGLHTFIRDNRSSNFSSSRGRRDGRGSNSGGGGTHLESSHSNAGGGDPRGVPTTDWAAQMQRELFSETDAFGGQAHKDYYRDPASGYSPRYAPRNFADGGAIAYHHSQSPLDYKDAARRRDWLDHDVLRMKNEFKEQRAKLREMSSPSEREAATRSYADARNVAGMIPENQSPHAMDQLLHSTSTSGEALRRHTVADRYDVAKLTSPPPLAGAMSREELADAFTASHAALSDDLLAENLRIAHGLREKEKFDFTVLQRNARVPFQGYDMDRFLAQQKGTPHGAQQLPPAVVPSTMEEAQRTLRGDTTPSSFEAISQKAYARNTVSERPGVGEELTQGVLAEVHGSRKARKKQEEQERQQRFGLGRQGPLVQDGGPDKRTLKKNTNDERILDAMKFSSDAYRKSPTDEHWNPYIRGDTTHGVGHLLNNKFDIQRREHRLASGAQDLTERSVIHYGVPIQQTVDEFVFRRRNARGERPLDYFRSFPNFRSLRLNRMYRDVEGFSLMKQRPDFLEWELFTRYRAHHQQRRRLALLHGLEPIANETAQERDARRLKLDEVCERTPFDENGYSVNDDEMKVNSETLRSWFGVYILPSPTVVEAMLGTVSSVNLHLYHLPDELGTADTREHVLSCRYLNKLLLLEAFQQRIGRNFVNEVTGRAPEPRIEYAQPPEVLRHFSSEERAMYEQYLKETTGRQLNEWTVAMRRRRWISEHQQYGHVVAQGYETIVVDLQHAETGAMLTVTKKFFEEQLKSSNSKDGFVRVDGQLYKLCTGSERSVVPLSVQLESGEVMDISSDVFERYEPEALSADANHALNYGIENYAYNRGNYVETQDVIWEEQTARGEDGWSPATHADALQANLPVRARRRVGPGVAGDFQRAVIVQYNKQPFFNPEPRLVRVAFQLDGAIEEVPLADVMIWQRRYHGPERTVGDESRRYNPMSLNRYIDVADPNNEKTTNELHFLDKYEQSRTAAITANKYRTTKQITEIDQWTRHDTRRPENYRPLSISHRRDYIRLGYMHRYTPWEWIATQEADQPLIREQIRHDNLGPSYFFSLNRYWRYKARPHGYIRHYENEVRDLFQFVDGVTPWKQAQKIRTYWEVRSHHPMPQFNRPEVAMHRNTVGLLPAHLWETDKKTGKVKGVKDSVRDYQTKTPLPKWVQL